MNMRSQKKRFRKIDIVDKIVLKMGRLLHRYEADISDIAGGNVTISNIYNQMSNKRHLQKLSPSELNHLRLNLQSLYFTML